MTQTPVKAKPQPTYTPTTPKSTKIVNQPQPVNPFTLYQNNPTTITPQPVQWLWQQRIPATGITILDGDHGLGKSLLALQFAASVSSGKPMPDGSPTIQGGVVIITPHEHGSTTQLQHLISLGADLTHIQFLSYVHNPNPQPQTDSFPSTSGYHPFSFPEDITPLLEAIEHVNARLIILDPFIYLLSQQQRHTSLRLSHLLTNLNQILTERGIACLLLRNCRAKGGQAKPSTLEKSDHFSTIGVSRLLLAPNPIQPPYILLSHALNRHGSLAQTLILQIQPLPTNPDLAHIIVHGAHSLTAAHFLTHRPTTLHRYLLSHLIPAILAQSSEPTHATDLYALFSHSSISQIQRALKDLLLTGQIQRPARGLYSSTSSTSSTPKLVTTAATTSTSKLNSPAATTSDSKLVATAATTRNSKLVTTAATTPPPKIIAPSATTFTAPSKLNASAATTPALSKLVTTAATTPGEKLIVSAATTPNSKLVTTAAATLALSELKSSAATTPTPKPARPHKHPHKQNKPHGRPR